MIFALAQPFALTGLILGLLAGGAVRHTAQRLASRAAAPYLPRMPHRHLGLHPLGILAACLTGAGFGVVGPNPEGMTPTARRLCVLSGPLAVLITGQLLLAGFRLIWPDERLSAIYLPSDVLVGAPATAVGPAGQLLFTTAVAMTCFGLIALLPLPAADGWSLWRPRRSRITGSLDSRSLWAVVLLLILIVPIGAMPAGHHLLDMIGAPLLRW